MWGFPPQEEMPESEKNGLRPLRGQPRVSRFAHEGKKVLIPEGGKEERGGNFKLGGTFNKKERGRSEKNHGSHQLGRLSNWVFRKGP